MKRKNAGGKKILWAGALTLLLLLSVCFLTYAEGGETGDSSSEAEAPVIPPETDPPETDPPETDPPETDPPETDPPETDPPETDPPETDPPETDPSETDPPETDPPETDPPETDPPETDPPETDPSETAPPETQPSETVPVSEPPTQPPAPVAVPAAVFTATGYNTGRLTGLTPDLAYSTDGGTTYRTITGTSLNLTLEPCTILIVRTADDGRQSEPQRIVVTRAAVPTYTKVDQGCPNAYGRLENLPDFCEVKVDNGEWTRCEDNTVGMMVHFYTYTLRVAAHGTVLASSEVREKVSLLNQDHVFMVGFCIYCGEIDYTYVAPGVHTDPPPTQRPIVPPSTPEEPTESGLESTEESSPGPEESSSPEETGESQTPEETPSSGELSTAEETPSSGEISTPEETLPTETGPKPSGASQTGSPSSAQASSALPTLPPPPEQGAMLKQILPWIIAGGLAAVLLIGVTILLAVRSRRKPAR